MRLLLNYPKIKILLILLGLFVFSLALRTYRITEVPPGFFCDEAAIGYNSWKLLITGKDEYGISWPLFFKSFGDYRLPIPIYLNVISTFIFGLSELSVRSMTAFLGSLSVPVVFLIGLRLKNIKVGLFASLFLAISNWHIHMSRWGIEYIYFPSFLLFGILFFLISEKNSRFLILSFVMLSLSLYTYYTSWIFIPFLILFFIFSAIKKRTEFKYILVSFLIFIIISLPLLKDMKEGNILSRWDSIGGSFDINNRLPSIIKYYFDSFSINFLFLSGDSGYPDHKITRHNIYGFGQLYVFELPLIILGLIYILKYRRKGLIVLYMFVLYPLGSVLTKEGPSATRLVVGTIIFPLISGFGAYFLLKIIQHKFFRMIYILLFVAIVSITFSRYLFQYYKYYPLYASGFWGWQSGPKGAVEYMVSVENEYDELYYLDLINAGEIFLPFYTLDGKLGCGKCRYGGFEKYKQDKKQLFIMNSLMLNELTSLMPYLNIKVVNIFYYPSGEKSNIAFVVLDQ